MGRLCIASTWGCGNNVLALMAVGDEDLVNHWLGMMSDIVEIMKNAIAQCL